MAGPNLNIAGLPSFDDWVKGGGGNIAPGQQMNAYLQFAKQFQGQQTDTQTQKTNQLNSDYGTAEGAINASRTADISAFQPQAALAQRKLLGSLNSRGLGSSVMGTTQPGISSTMPTVSKDPGGLAAGARPDPGASMNVGGYGSGALSALATRSATNLGNINAGYDALSGNLAQQKAAGNLNISDFYNNLNLAQRKAQASQADVFDYLGGLTNAGSSLLMGFGK